MSEFITDLGWYGRIEAPEGAGKTTQVNLMKAFALEHDIDAVFVHEPGGTELGKILREILLQNENFTLTPEAELAIFTADRIYLWENVILPALKANQLVISDRGPESGVGYQAGGGKMKAETIWEVTRLLLPERYVTPDALAILSISRETQRQRLNKRHLELGRDKIESRGEEYFDRVHAAYKKMQLLGHATTIDAEPSPEEIFENVKPVLFGPFLPRDTHKTLIV